MRIAIGFDETCVTGGADVPGAVEVLQRLGTANHRLCLWTCRYPNGVAEAVHWFNSRGIPLQGVNRWTGAGLTPSSKLAADVYIDDRGMGIPLILFAGRWVVNWAVVEEMLEACEALPPHASKPGPLSLPVAVPTSLPLVE